MTPTENFNKDENNNLVAGGESKFFHVEILPKHFYKRFRTQNVGEIVGIESVGGQLASGKWETIKWIVSNEIAHCKNGELIADNRDAQELFDKIGFVPQHIEGNRYGVKADLLNK